MCDLSSLQALRMLKMIRVWRLIKRVKLPDSMSVRLSKSEVQLVVTTLARGGTETCSPGLCLLETWTAPGLGSLPHWLTSCLEKELAPVARSASRCSFCGSTTCSPVAILALG